MSNETEQQKQSGPIPQSRPWTRNEIEYIAIAGEKIPMDKIALRLGRTEAECAAVWSGVKEERTKQAEKPVAPVELLFTEMARAYETVGTRIMDVSKWLCSPPSKEAVSQVILEGLTKTRASKLEGWQFTDKELADSLALHMAEFFAIYYHLIVEKGSPTEEQPQTDTSS